MKASEYKELIEFRVNLINQKLGTDYKSDYVSHYGGWNLYLINKNNGGLWYGEIGFMYRKSSAEMLAYLDGILAGIRVYRLTI